MKNHYILNPGEFFVVDELSRGRKDLVLCIPVQDRGWDVLALKKGVTEPLRIQVKESRYYLRGQHSWHQLKASETQYVDVFVSIGPVPPAFGYGHEMRAKLEQTINDTEVDVILVGTPIDLGRFLKRIESSESSRFL